MDGCINILEIDKVLVLSTRDLKVLNRTDILDYVINGFYVLPIDQQAILFVKHNNIQQFTLIDDWLSEADVKQVLHKANSLERTWFEEAGNTFTCHGINWPEVDRHAMNIFWRELILSEFLGDAFLKNNVKEIVAFQVDNPTASVYDSETAIYTEYWKYQLKGRVRYTPKMLSFSKPVSASLIRLAYKKALSLKSKIKEMLFSDYRGNSIVKSFYCSNEVPTVLFTLHPAEFNRFKSLINRLKEVFDKRLQIITIYNCGKELAAAINHPISQGPTYSDIDLKVKTQLGRAYRALVKRNKKEEKFGYLGLEFHFLYYCRLRWPRLAGASIFWRQYFAANKPLAVITSSLYDLETQLPAIIAKEFGIQTFSVPHSGLTLADNLIFAEKILYNYPIQKLYWREVGIDERKFIGCRDLLTENQYGSVPYDASFINDLKQPLVVVITNPLDRLRMQEACARQYIDSYRAIIDPPAEVAKNISIKVKLYPSEQELHFVKSLFPEIEECLIGNIDLSYLIARADLVITLDYLGSALIHTYNLEKPVIHYVPSENKRIDYLRQEYMRIKLLEEGFIVSNKDDLWNAVKNFFNNEDFRGDLRIRSKKAKQLYTEFSNFSSPEDIIKKYIKVA